MSQEEQQTQLILDSIPSLVFLKDTENRILRVNQAVANAIGIPREQIEGRHSREVYPKDADRFFADDRAVISSGKAKIGYDERSGDLWVRTDKIPIRGVSGDFDRVLVIATDITGQKRAEEAERKTRELLEVAGRMASLGGWELDVRSGRLTWSDQVRRIHEVPDDFTPTVEQAIGFYTPGSRERIERLVARGLETGESWDDELELCTSTGRRIWVRTIGEAEFDGETCVRLWGTLQDITERKRLDEEMQELNRQLLRRAEESEAARQKSEDAEAELASVVKQLTESEARYRTLFEEAPVMHANVSPIDATIKDCNQMMVTRLGYRSKADVIGRPIFSMYAKNYLADAEQAFQEFVETGEVKNKALMLQTVGGEQIPVTLNVASVRDESGGIVLSSSTWSDVSELTKLNEELQEFAYIASHDLKAPLRAISHLATWLDEDLEGELKKSSAQHLAQLKQRVKRMDRLLDDLLVYSRAGQRGHKIKSIDLTDLVDGIAELHAASRSFMVCLDLSVTTFEACETPLETVIRNLISNSIKHHDRGHARIVVGSESRDERVVISVTDDGPGIPPEHRERVMHMFQTLRPRDEVEGSGMGLALAKRIVEAHGGEIEVRDAKPRGTRVRISWPIEPTAPMRQPEEDR